MIWVQNQLVGAREGQRLTLECNSEAYPKSINYWTRDKDEIVPQGTLKLSTIVFPKHRSHVCKGASFVQRTSSLKSLRTGLCFLQIVADDDNKSIWRNNYMVPIIITKQNAIIVCKCINTPRKKYCHKMIEVVKQQGRVE